MVGSDYGGAVVLTAATAIEEHIMPMDNRKKIEMLYYYYELYNLLLTYIEERVDELKSNNTTNEKTGDT